MEATDELIAHDVNSSVHMDDAQTQSQHLEEGGDHCTHCCHAHVGNVLLQASNSNPAISNQRILAETLHIDNPISGPPTPPPNA